MTWRKHISSWLAGGCLVCGEPNRKGFPFAHMKCWELDLTQADRNDIYMELKEVS